MKRVTLSFQIFLAIVAVALGTAVTVGLFARGALSSAFDAYLSGLPSRGAQGRGMGRMMLGAAEQTFISRVDTSVVIAAGVAVMAATILALALAAYLNRPLRRLEAAAEELAAGELDHRVEANGPAEVAAIGDAFNRMADSLEEAEALRRRLVADVAHELRNPIAAARLQAEGMAEGVLPADTNRLESLVEDLEHLSTLVDDLQELAVAEAGRLTYHMDLVDVADLVAREIERASDGAPAGVAVTAKGVDTEALAHADERRLSQVLRNLLSNAVRHTSTGAVTAHIDASAETIRVSVTDTGEGIAAEDLPHIFERFFRADTARASHTGGAGLGLAISRSIVRDHGGEMGATSEPGRGTTVWFTVPAARAPHRVT